MSRVVMLVNSNFWHDSRVQKEALALRQEGYGVTVFSLTMTGPREQNFRGVRLVNPTTGRLSWFPYRWSYLKACWQTLGALLREGGDVWHGHDLEALPFVFLARGLKGGKLVYDSHELWRGYDWPGSGGRWGAARRLLWQVWLWLEKALAKRCHLVITVNESCAREMAGALGIKPPLVLRNCVDPVYKIGLVPAGLRERLGLNREELLVVYSGHLKKGRGLESLLKAWAALPARGHLAFLGSGPLEEHLQGFVYSAGLKNVHFLPPVQAWEQPGFLKGASLGVVLTEERDLSSRLSLPNKLFEYVAAGIPVLASGLPEISRLVEEYGIGLLTVPGDPGSVKAALEEILNGGKKLAEFKKNILRAREELTWQEEVRRLLNAYSKIKVGNHG